jgi:hypothetical protein
LQCDDVRIQLRQDLNDAFWTHLSVQTSAFMDIVGHHSKSPYFTDHASLSYLHLSYRLLFAAKAFSVFSLKDAKRSLPNQA